MFSHFLLSSLSPSFLRSHFHPISHSNSLNLTLSPPFFRNSLSQAFFSVTSFLSALSFSLSLPKQQTIQQTTLSLFFVYLLSLSLCMCVCPQLMARIGHCLSPLPPSFLRLLSLSHAPLDNFF